VSFDLWTCRTATLHYHSDTTKVAITSRLLAMEAALTVSVSAFACRDLFHQRSQRTVLYW
jgi:hypothetical protein